MNVRSKQENRQNIKKREITTSDLRCRELFYLPQQHPPTSTVAQHQKQYEGEES